MSVTSLLLSFTGITCKTDKIPKCYTEKQTISQTCVLLHGIWSFCSSCWKGKRTAGDDLSLLHNFVSCFILDFFLFRTPYLLKVDCILTFTLVFITSLRPEGSQWQPFELLRQIFLSFLSELQNVCSFRTTLYIFLYMKQMGSLH